LTTSKAASPKPFSTALEGRVVDKTTGAPIPFVEVGLQPAPEMRRYTFTDNEGRFSFLNPPASPYQLVAGKQRWSVSEMFVLSPSIDRPTSEFFAFNTPSTLIIRNRDGRISEGECGVSWIQGESAGFSTFFVRVKRVGIAGRESYARKTVKSDATLMALVLVLKSFFEQLHELGVTAIICELEHSRIGYVNRGVRRNLGRWSHP